MFITRVGIAEKVFKVRGQRSRSEVKDQGQRLKIKVRCQRSRSYVKDQGQWSKIKVRGQRSRSEVRGQRSEVKVRGQRSEVKGQGHEQTDFCNGGGIHFDGVASRLT